MKTRSILFAAAIAMGAVISCQKEAQIADETPIQEPVQDETPADDDIVVFSAITENPLTKTELSDNGDDTYTVLWKSGDAININGYNLSLQTTDQPAGYGPGYARGNFSGTITPPESGTSPKYKALYPSSIFGTPGSLPTEQTYVADNVDAFPMYAESDTRSFEFHNLCGIIRIGLKGDTRSVSSITLVDVDDTPKPMSGRYTISSNTAVITSGSAGTSLICSPAVALNTETFTYFYITVPANSYGKLKIMIEASDGYIWTLTSKSAIVVERSMITNINLSSPKFKNDKAQITYTTYSGNKIGKFSGGDDASVFGDGLTVISHTYEGGVGTISLKGEVTKIGDSAFNGLSDIVTMTIPSTVTSIGGSAFRGLNRLTTLNIPAGVTSIGDMAFQSCRNFNPAGQLDNVTSFGGLSFNDTGLAGDLVLSGAVTKVDNYAFKQSPLSSVTFEGTPSTLGNYIFQSCASLEEVTFEDDITVTNYMFDACTALETVTFGGDCASIGQYAFRGCTSLTSISYPSGLTSVNQGAFENSGLTSMPSGWEAGGITYGSGVFKGSAITSITFPDSWTTLPRGDMCREMPALASVHLPNSLETIDQYAFYNCTALESITIPASVTYIGPRAFQGSGLTDLPSGLNGTITLRDYIFAGTKMTDITLPDGMTTIPENMFNGCSSLTRVDLNDVTTINNSAFFNCSSLVTIVADNVITLKNSVFDTCPSIVSVTLPAATTIGQKVFNNCTKLESVSLPSAVTLGQEVFYGCTKLETVNIGSGITSIGSNCFRDNTSLTSLTIRATSVPTLTTTLSNHGSFTPTIYVPASAVDDYKVASVWSNYESRITAIVE